MNSFYQAETDDIWRHLAVEEYLLDTLPAGGRRLLVWSSRDAVVIGKHQNPWVECRLGAMADDDVKLARRISGGGAVWHDLGNLNYTFLVERHDYDREELQELVLAAVRSLGIAAELGERHILEVARLKFSGNAFCFRRQKVLHHGTLLLSADLARLKRYLRQAPNSMETRAVASVPSPVTNLQAFRADLSPDLMSDALHRTVAKAWGTLAPCAMDDLQDPAIDKLQKRQQEWDWQFGYTPKFDVQWACGNQTLTVHVERAHITDVHGDDVTDIREVLLGCRYEQASVHDALLGLPPERREGVTDGMISHFV